MDSISLVIGETLNPNYDEVAINSPDLCLYSISS
jgi:hypothetical protein